MNIFIKTGGSLIETVYARVSIIYLSFTYPAQKQNIFLSKGCSVIFRTERHKTIGFYGASNLNLTKGMAVCLCTLGVIGNIPIFILIESFGYV